MVDIGTVLYWLFVVILLAITFVIVLAGLMLLMFYSLIRNWMKAMEQMREGQKRSMKRN